jgi:hypothetical protein
MPLELGLDLGCRRFGNQDEQEKIVLVMDIEPFRYQKFISDIGKTPLGPLRTRRYRATVLTCASRCPIIANGQNRSAIAPGRWA